MLLVRVRVDGREEAPDTFRTQVECSLAIWRIRSVGRDRDVRQIVSRPTLGFLVPPDEGLRTRIWLAVPIARSSVVENAHVVRPGPPEIRIEAETSRIRLRVATLRQVLAVSKDARVDPRAGRRGTVGPKIADLADEIARLEAGLRVVA